MIVSTSLWLKKCIKSTRHLVVDFWSFWLVFWGKFSFIFFIFFWAKEVDFGVKGASVSRSISGNGRGAILCILKADKKSIVPYFLVCVREEVSSWLVRFLKIPHPKFWFKFCLILGWFLTALEAWIEEKKLEIYPKKRFESLWFCKLINLWNQFFHFDFSLYQT